MDVLNLPYSGFQPTNVMSALAAIFYMLVTQTKPLTSLMSRLGKSIQCQKWGPYKVRGLLSQPVCAKEERNQQPSGNQGVSKVELRHSHAVCTHPLGAPNHLLPSGPFWLHRTLQKTMPEVTSQDESFMMSTDGFIDESQI